ncbi:MAG TPA: hypothetical protein VGL57_10465 [Solirubrobacteraceae bacterium]|jgi:hypothetical protein
MFTRIRRRVTYANVAVTFALVFAMSGGAYAAGRYTITSTRQISPKVLKSLKGARGNTGPAGTAGGQGPAGSVGAQGSAGTKGETGATGEKGETGIPGKPGEPGKEGSPWTAGGTLPPEKTEKGTWTITVPPPVEPAPGEHTISLDRAPISFNIPLETAPTGVFLKEGEKQTGCQGTAEEPTAEPGYLCVYAQVEVKPPPGLAVGATYPFGAVLGALNGEPGGTAYGSWAVTAP